ncbi:hypothetical protein BC941DRAFT_442949 [Chlamydoabsidia padenii]|nr:hypothetical protein BC941DRAFT_442949 [Chlamydoabsidia padenii]
MTLPTPHISPLVTTLKKQQQQENTTTALPRNSQQHPMHLNNKNSTSSLFANLSTGPEKAMSVLSSALSYQYSSTLDTHDYPEDGTSIHSAPTLPEDDDALTKKDLDSVIESHKDLLAAAQTYREQLTQLASASANFGIALETAAKHKTTMDAGDGLMAAGGLQFLISNHHQILADTMHKTFEISLAEHIEEHKSTIKKSQDNYNTALQMISKNIRQKETANLQQAKKGQRDLRQYRRTLTELTRQVDELDYIKTTYNQRMLGIEQHYHQALLYQTGWLVRAQVDVYELLASKGLSDSTLEQLIQQHPDPFNSYATDTANDFFTVLPPSSLIDPLPTTTSSILLDTDKLVNPTYFDSRTTTPFLYKRPGSSYDQQRSKVMAISSGSSNSGNSSSDEHSSTDTSWNDERYTKEIPACSGGLD